MPDKVHLQDSHALCREALHLTSLGMSPYTGSAYHAPPLLLPLLRGSALAATTEVLILPYIAADICASLAIRRIVAAVHRTGTQMHAFLCLNCSHIYWGMNACVLY